MGYGVEWGFVRKSFSKQEQRDVAEVSTIFFHRVMIILILRFRSSGECVCVCANVLFRCPGTFSPPCIYIYIYILLYLYIRTHIYIYTYIFFIVLKGVNKRMRMRSNNMKKKEGDHSACSVHYIISINLYFGQLHDF